MDLSQTLSQTSRHVEMVCVCDFPHGEVSVKVNVMEFGLYRAQWSDCDAVIKVWRPAWALWINDDKNLRSTCDISYTWKQNMSYVIHISAIFLMARFWVWTFDIKSVSLGSGDGFVISEAWFVKFFWFYSSILFDDFVMNIHRVPNLVLQISSCKIVNTWQFFKKKIWNSLWDS